MARDDEVQLPNLEDFRTRDPAVIWGLVRDELTHIERQSFEHDRLRDNARWEAVDRGLSRAARGETASPANPPQWFPKMVRDLVQSAANSSWTAPVRFWRIRLMHQLGMIRLDVDDDVILAFVGALRGFKALSHSSLDRLKRDTEWLDTHFWRIFEVEGGGEVSLTNIDCFSKKAWQSAITELIDDGYISRSRVLAECLRALARDFSTYRASWFSTTFLHLSPSLGELAELQPALRKLLHSQVKPTVALATRQLNRLAKEGQFDVEAAMPGLVAAASISVKGTAVQALALCRQGKLAQLDQELLFAAAAAAAGHPHVDVQRAAVNLLREGQLEHRISELTDVLSLVVRSEVELGPDEGTSVETEPSIVASPYFGRGPAASISAEELPERLAAAIAGSVTPEEFEGLLAALAAQPNPDTLQPLKRLAAKVTKPKDHPGHEAQSTRRILADATLLVLGVTRPEPPPADPLMDFWLQRTHEAIRGEGPLLATPDLPGGFVSAKQFMARWLENPEPRSWDLVQALLRLEPPPGNAARLELLNQSERDAVEGLPEAVRFAFQQPIGTRPQTSKQHQQTALWKAAEHSLNLLASHEQMGWNATVTAFTPDAYDPPRTFYSVEFAAHLPDQSLTAHQYPAAVRQAIVQEWDGAQGLDESGVALAAAVWPHDAEQFSSLLISEVWTATNGEVHRFVPHILDALAAHPGRIGPLAIRTLAAGLCTEKAPYRVHAVDALADIAPSGRLSAQDVGAVLGEFTRAWPANRWTAALASLADVPGLHRFVLEVLSSAIVKLEYDYPCVGKPLTLFQELRLRGQAQPLAPELLAWLEAFPGSGAAARTARSLVQAEAS